MTDHSSDPTTRDTKITTGHEGEAKPTGRADDPSGPLVAHRDPRALRGPTPDTAGSVVVAKVGGSIAPRCQSLLAEVAGHQQAVLVHGFGPQTTARCQALGIEHRVLTSPSGRTSRFTDEAVLEAMQAAAAEVAGALAHQLANAGARVARIDGDQGVLGAKTKPVLRHVTDDGRTLIVRGNRSGMLTHVDPGVVLAALDRGELPLLTPLAADEADLVSVDGDRAAAALASALGAGTLLLFTDVGHVLDARGQPIDQLTPGEAQALIEEGAAEGGMARKLTAAQEALEGGVERVIITDGTRDQALARALEGAGTEVRR